MANALARINTPPPAPNDDNALAQQQGAGPEMPGGAQAMPQAAPGGGNASAQQQPTPAPSHAETVAALRHFHAIEGELRALAANPALGKSDIKKSIIDGMEKLVGSMLLTPTQAVDQLITVPERPFDQKQWVLGHLQNAIAAQNAVLDHHRAANQGSGDWASEGPASAHDPDAHADAMASLMQHYKKG